MKDFDFIKKYKSSVLSMLKSEVTAINDLESLNEREKKIRTSGCAVGTVYGDIMDDFSSVNLNQEIKILIDNVESINNKFLSNIIVEPINKTTSVIRLSLTSKVREKGVDVLNELIYQYEKDSKRKHLRNCIPY